MQHLKATFCEDQANPPSWASLVRSKNKIEAKIKAIYDVARSCRQIGAGADSFTDLCWTPVDIVIPEDSSKEEAAALLYAKCTLLEEKDAILSKDTASFADFNDNFLKMCYFTSRGDGRLEIDNRAISWKNWRNWEFNIRTWCGDSYKRPYRFKTFKELYVAQAKALNRPLEVCKAEMYRAIMGLGHKWV